MQAAARQPITAEARQYMRQYLDREKRKALAAARTQYGQHACAGCGGELDDVTRGCRTCHDRRRRRGQPRSDAHNRPPLRPCRQCGRRTRSRNQLCLDHSILPSRPAGHLELVANRSKSPAGRTPPTVKSVSVRDRQSREAE